MKRAMDLHSHLFAPLHARSTHSSTEFIKINKYSSEVTSLHPIFKKAFTKHKSICLLPKKRIAKSVVTCSTKEVGLNRPNISSFVEKRLFLQNLGIDSTNPSYPELIIHPISNFNKLLDLLNEYGLDKEILPKLVTSFPAVLSLDLEDSLALNLQFLISEVKIEKGSLSKVLIRCPKLLVCSVEDRLRPTFQFFTSCGMKNINKHAVSIPHLLAYEVDIHLRPRIQFLEQLGISRKNVLRMIQRCPSIFNYSTEMNLKPKVNYLLNEMNRDIEELVTFPQFFGFSLEKRIKPRFKLATKRDMVFTLSSLLTPRDDDFLKN